MCTFQGEQYKLIWPEQSEFVRMAARFGAKIVPFGVAGEDDFGEVSMEWFIFFLIVFPSVYFCVERSLVCYFLTLKTCSKHEILGE